MQSQALIAMNDADLVLFLTDSRTNLTSEDYKVADLLRKKCQKPVIFCITKCD
jgi:GTP-binding protein